MSMRRLAGSRRSAVATAAALLVVLVAGAAPAQNHTVVIEIERYLFSPAHIEVAFGQPITWRNNESGTVPPNPVHNIVRDLFIPPGEIAPQSVTQRICEPFGPGESCSPEPEEIGLLLPRGRHILTCTIDRDHSVLMRHVIDVV